MKRRDFLYNSLAMAGVSCIPSFWPQQAFAAGPGQLVFIFLRGGADALGLVSPSGAAYNTLKTWRPTLSVTAPVAYNANLLLHPRLAPFAQDAVIAKNLNFILHAGSLNETRSHFEQMARIEAGDAIGMTPTGFLARAAVSMPGRNTFAVGANVPASLKGTNPVVLQDPAKIQPGYTGQKMKTGITRTQRLGMYKQATGQPGDPLISKYANLAQAQFDLLDNDLPLTLPQLVSGNAYLNTEFGQRLAVAGAMLASSANPAVVCVDADHKWDTHAVQGTNILNAVSFGTKVNDLARNLISFKNDLVKRGKWATTTVVVMSEFGRTLKENADNGTDHGRGGVMILMGGAVRAHSNALYKGDRTWTLPATVDSSTSLAVKYDYRLVLAEILEKQLLIPQATVKSTLFLNQIDPTKYLGVV